MDVKIDYRRIGSYLAGARRRQGLKQKQVADLIDGANNTTEQLYAAMNTLPEKQRHRIYDHYILKIPQSEIARLDGVDHRTVNISIQRGLHNLERYLKNIF